MAKRHGQRKRNESCRYVQLKGKWLNKKQVSAGRSRRRRQACISAPFKLTNVYPSGICANKPGWQSKMASASITIWTPWHNTCGPHFVSGFKWSEIRDKIKVLSLQGSVCKNLICRVLQSCKKFSKHKYGHTKTGHASTNMAQIFWFGGQVLY